MLTSLSLHPLSLLQPHFQLRERADGREGLPSQRYACFLPSENIILSYVASCPPAGSTVTVSLSLPSLSEEGQESNLGSSFPLPSERAEGSVLLSFHLPKSQGL